MSLLKNAKRRAVVEEAKKLFLSEGIQQVTIQDLAKHLTMGEATLYRYFGKKQTLVMEAGILIWEDVLEKMEGIGKKATGYDSIEAFYSFFLTTFQEHKEFFLFAEEFDQLLFQESMEEELLLAYESVILKLKGLFDGHFQMGLQDGSIRRGVDQDLFYFSTNHAVLGLCRKLAREKSLMKYEDRIGKISQIQCLLDICMNYIKVERGEN